MSSKKDRYDNALAEAINLLFRAELIHRRGPWKKLANLEWVALFIYQDLLGPIGYIPPDEAEANYYLQRPHQAETVA